MPSLTKVFRRRTSRLKFFARITSAPMSFHFCADGVAVLGTVWIPASQSKLQLSAGACVDGTGRSQIRRATAARARLKYKVENRWLVLSNRISSSDKRRRPRRGRSRWKSFRAKAADPALAERLTARAARAAERSAIKTTREIERAEKEVREAERAQQAERGAAIEAERAKAESGERERALQAKQKAARDARYAARKSRPKRRSVRPLHGT